MKGTWIRFVLVAAALGAAAGCGGDDTNATGSGASGGGGSGGSGGTGGSGGAGGETTTAATTTTTTSTTTAPPGPCDGVIEGFKPEWKPPEGIHQGLCADAAQIAQFFAACLESGATEAGCNTFNDDPANAACSNCAVSLPEDPTYGPMTVYEMPVVLYENPGQCISEIEGDTSAASCGAKVFFTIQCQVSACEKCEYGEGEFQTLLDCLDAAKLGSCKPYADAEAQCLAALQGQGVDIDVCLPPTTGTVAQFYQYLKDMTLFVCGP